MKNYLKAFLLMSTVITLKAQTYDDYLNGDKKDFFQIYENENILITNDGDDTIFSGYIAFTSDTQGSVTIKADNGYAIIIIPVTNGSRNPLGTGTQIGTRPPPIGGLNGKITLYPNPVQSQFQLNSTINITGYKIYNSFGVLKSEIKSINNKNIQTDLKTFSPGIYHILISLENGQTISKQFIKQ